MTNPSNDTQGEALAVGLAYDPAHGLPRVILKGQGQLAHAIVEAADHEAQVPVVQDGELARTLYRLRIDTEIGRELFEVVAILLSHVFAMDHRKGNSHD